MREDSAFDLFWERAQTTQKELGVDDPVLHRMRKRPRRYEDGTAEPHLHEDPKLYYRSLYYQCLDAAAGTIKSRFQRDFDIILV